MTDEEIIAIIEQEFKEKIFSTTEQYLEIHGPVYIDGKLHVERFDRENDNGIVIAYLPVQDERFYFTACIDTKNNTFNGLNTESYNQVYFTATSEELSEIELSTMTKLNPTKGWSKGDLRKNGKSKHTFSRISIEPNPEPDEFEDKLHKLLDYLEQDKEGILQLVNKAEAWIGVHMKIHNGNGMIGGIHLDDISIQRMAALGLSIDFDMYVGGNMFL